MASATLEQETPTSSASSMPLAQHPIGVHTHPLGPSRIQARHSPLSSAQKRQKKKGEGTALDHDKAISTVRLLKLGTCITVIKIKTVPWRVAQLVGASSCTLRGCRFHYPSGHMPRWRFRSPVWVCTGRQSMFLFPSLSLSLPFFKKEKRKISLDED